MQLWRGFLRRGWGPSERGGDGGGAVCRRSPGRSWTPCRLEVEEVVMAVDREIRVKVGREKGNMEGERRNSLRWNINRKELIDGIKERKKERDFGALR